MNGRKERRREGRIHLGPTVYREPFRLKPQVCPPRVVRCLRSSSAASASSVLSREWGCAVIIALKEVRPEVAHGSSDFVVGMEGGDPGDGERNVSIDPKKMSEAE